MLKETKKEYWSNHLQSQESGGQSQKAYCKDQGVNQHTFKSTTDDGRTRRAILVESADRRAHGLTGIKREPVATRE